MSMEVKANVIKRNGQEVPFEIEKIANAIRKANKEVDRIHQLNEYQIVAVSDKIAREIGDMPHAAGVEDIQDMVEKGIMEMRGYEVAQKYVRYRYKRELARKTNTTDNGILALINQVNEEVNQENSNKNPAINSTQRDYMAGEVSKDLTRRVLLPEDVVNAHDEGIIHFHDSDYFAQKEHNCDLVNLEDMLQNGTVISETMITKPHSFLTACNIATQIIAQVASNQYGGQTFTLAHLSPFVQESRIRLRAQTRENLKEAGLEASEEQINRVAEERLKREITSGVLFDLTCVVSSYRKPDFQGSFYSPKGTWDVEFWDTRGEEPVFVCALYLEAPTEDPQVLLLADGVRYESLYENPENALRIDPNGENSAEVRDRIKARDLVTDRFSADYGINQYYADLVNELGPFRYWTSAQKYEHCGVLMELLYWESQRLSLYHEGEPRPSGLLEAPVLEWRYGDPASAAVPEEEARQKALAFLDERYGMDCSACRVSTALYTGHSNWLEAFADPCWVFGFYNVTEDREAEVWVNAMTGETPKHRTDDAEAVVREEFARYIKEEDYEIGGRKVTEDMVDGISLLYLEAEGQWYGIVAIGDSYWEIALDADTLEPLDVVRSNG